MHTSVMRNRNSQVISKFPLCKIMHAPQDEIRLPGASARNGKSDENGRAGHHAGSLRSPTHGASLYTHSRGLRSGQFRSICRYSASSPLLERILSPLFSRAARAVHRATGIAVSSLSLSLRISPKSRFLRHQGSFFQTRNDDPARDYNFLSRARLCSRFSLFSAGFLFVSCARGSLRKIYNSSSCGR